LNGGNWKEMFNAACDGDLELVTYHVTSGVDVNYAHPEFLSTPLVAAILAKQEAIALYLLENGAKPNLFSEFDGVRPMQAAMQSGLLRVQEKLLSLGIAQTPVEPKSRNWVTKVFARGLRW
jgi:uncharacterized protein